MHQTFSHLMMVEARRQGHEMGRKIAPSVLELGDDDACSERAGRRTF